MMYTVSPSPYGWLTQITGVVLGALVAHGSGDATEPTVLFGSAWVPEPRSAIPSPAPTAMSATAATARAQAGSTTSVAGRVVRPGTRRRRDVRRSGGSCPARTCGPPGGFGPPGVPGATWKPAISWPA